MAREADAEISYRQIQRYWNSLHDLTGNQILFVFAGALKDEYSSVLHHEYESWRGLQNTTLHILDKNSFTIPYYKYPKIDFNKHCFGKIAVNHTRSISELRDYFGLTEKVIPSLVFTPTYWSIQDKHITVPLKVQLMEISRQVELLNRGTKDQRRYVNAKSWLKEIINNTDNDIIKNNLIKAMRSRVVDEAFSISFCSLL